MIFLYILMSLSAYLAIAMFVGAICNNDIIIGLKWPMLILIVFMEFFRSRKEV